MKLLEYRQKEDFGTEHIFTLIKGKRRSFIQLGLSWNEYPGAPYFQLAMGNNRVIDILFWCWKCGCALEVFSNNWDMWDKNTQ